MESLYSSIEATAFGNFSMRSSTGHPSTSMPQPSQLVRAFEIQRTPWPKSSMVNLFAAALPSSAILPRHRKRRSATATCSRRSSMISASTAADIEEKICDTPSRITTPIRRHHAVRELQEERNRRRERENGAGLARALITVRDFFCFFKHFVCIFGVQKFRKRGII